MDPADLYGLPLERFTAARNELAKALRKAGRRDEAAAATKLRKPSVAAWAVNQLVRTQRRDLEALFDAGDALQRAQAAVLQGKGGREALNRASDAERAAAERLIEKARGLLDDDGHEPSATTLDRVAETLHAAALDPEARAQVQPGTLERELRHVGLGGIASGGEAAGDRHAAELAAARTAEDEARTRAEQAARELREAERRRERAASELRAADEALARARQHAGASRGEHEQARDRRERAERKLGS